MSRNLLRRLQAFFSAAPQPLTLPRRGRRRRPLLECLEERVTPTATLYVDFGDRYPSSGLTGTIEDLVSHTHNGNPAVNGPDLTFFFNSTDDFNLLSFNKSHKGSTAADL